MVQVTVIEMLKEHRNKREDYFAPTSSIDGSNIVSGVSTNTLNILERISCRSVPLAAMVAHWTVLTGIENSPKSGFAFDEGEGELLMDINEKAVMNVMPKKEKKPFLLAALVLYLVDVIASWMKDFRLQIQTKENQVTKRTEKI